jgi:hypothetical protein
MKELMDIVWSQVQKQGLAYILIVLIAYLFYTENQKLKEIQIDDRNKMNAEIKQLRNEINDCNRNTNLLILNELQKSTLAIEKFNERVTR